MVYHSSFGVVARLAAMKIQLALVCPVMHSVTTKVLPASALGQLKLLHGQQDITAVGRVVDVGLELIQCWQPLSRKSKITRQIDFLKRVDILLGTNVE